MHFKISVCTQWGAPVRTLYDEDVIPGLKPIEFWDEKDDAGHPVPPGRYLLKFESRYFGTFAMLRITIHPCRPMITLASQAGDSTVH